MNRWMNDSQVLAQFGHFFGAYSLILTAAWIGTVLHSRAVLPVVLALFVAYALVKEAWYDMRYELPRQTWGDSAVDFAFYMLGAMAGLGASLGIRALGAAS